MKKSGLFLCELCLGLLCLGALAVFLWWGFFRTVEHVETEVLSRGDIENAVSAMGVVKPRHYVDVGVQVSGQIRRIAVQVGTTVKQGQLLMEIDPVMQRAVVDTHQAALSSLRAQLSEQQAMQRLAEQQLDRQIKMAIEGSTKIEDVQHARASVKVAKARVRSLKAQIAGAVSTLKGNKASLDLSRIHAPMAGTVIALDAREGQTLNAAYQTPVVLRIADLSRMTVWAEVSEANVGQVRAGMPLYFTTLGLRDDNGDQRRWNATLRQVLPAPISSLDQTRPGGTGTVPAGRAALYTALFDVDNPDGALLPQMNAQVFFVSARATNVLRVPLSLLEPVAGKPAHFTAKVYVNDRIKERQVRIGLRDRLHGEVLEGLKEGELLVTGIRQERASRRLQW